MYVLLFAPPICVIMPITGPTGGAFCPATTIKVTAKAPQTNAAIISLDVGNPGNLAAWLLLLLLVRLAHSALSPGKPAFRKSDLGTPDKSDPGPWVGFTVSGVLLCCVVESVSIVYTFIQRVAFYRSILR